MANKFELAQKAWPILTDAAKVKSKVQYGDLCNVLFGHPANAIRYALSPIQDLCLEKGLPPLTSLVVNKKGEPGSGFIAWHGNIQDAHAQVFAEDWSRINPPFDESLITWSTEKISELKVKRDFSVPDQKVMVNGRGSYQDIFRQQLLQIYGHRCAACDTKLTELLVASHIVPWSADPSNRLNPHNGILLCRIHDTLFEGGYMKINATWEIALGKLSPQVVGRSVFLFIKKATYPKIKIQMKEFRPDPVFLDWREKQR